MTPQEKRDQDYLEGYADAIEKAQLGERVLIFPDRSISYFRGYRDGAWGFDLKARAGA